MIQISLDNLIAVLALVTTWVASLVTVAYWAARRVATGDESLRTEIISVKTHIAEYKLEVAKTYASNVSMKETEERLLNGIERLTDEVSKMRETFLDVITVLRIPPAAAVHGKSPT